MTTSSLVARTAAILTLGACLVACSSNGDGDKGGASSSSKQIRLMVDTTYAPAAAMGGIGFPYPVTGAQAAADAINKAGGIDGHQIKIDVCDNKADPNQSAVCGRQAVENGDVAVVGAFDVFGATQILPVLEKARIPYVAPLGSNPIELQNPVTFSVDPGAVVGKFALAQVWLDSGCKSVVEYVSPSPINQSVVPQQQEVVQAAGATLKTISVSIGQADVAAVVSSGLAAHPDCISFGDDGQTGTKLLAAVRKAGFDGKFITVVGSLLPPFLASLGPLGDGTIAINSTLAPDSDDPMVTQFRNDVLASAGKDGEQSLNEFAQASWSGVQLVKQALTGETQMTAAALLKKLPTMCDVNVGNYYPHLNFCKPVHSKTFPRVFNAQFRYLTAKKGVYVPSDDQWHDLSATIPD